MADAMTKFAEDYGYQLAFLKSDPELYGVFKKAVSGKWDATRFVAAVKASSWYKKHGEAYRQNLALKTTDPATWKQRVQAQFATLQDQMSAMGASLSTKDMQKVAEDSILFGWEASQVRNVLASHIKVGRSGYQGQMGSDISEMANTAYRNGIRLSQKTMSQWGKDIATGARNLDDQKRQIRQMAKTLAPRFTKELDGGIDLFDIASPYMQSMATTLELNPSDIDLFDPTIRKALGAPETEGGGSMWEFEQQLRQDGRFMKTKQAQDQGMSLAKKVLQDFGLSST